jgi:primosomal replication protein N
LNHLSLSAVVVQVDTLRYTPAGVPAVNLVLEHQSDVLEMGLKRQVSLILKAVAFGADAQTLSRLDLNTALEFDGFLTTARNHKGVVFHIQAFKEP